MILIIHNISRTDPASPGYFLKIFCQRNEKKIVNFVSVKLHLRFLMTILYNNIIIYALSLPYSVVRFYFLAPEVPEVPLVPEVGVRG